MASVAKLAIGCLVFGVLMAVRDKLDSPSTRALVAAAAGAILGACLAQRKR
jgi:hypothetical protein